MFPSITMMRYSRLRSLALAAFFLSGASALIYEVTWVRLLSLAFGVSVYAISAVLTAFMGGLALGSWLLGRAVRGAGSSDARMLRIYALLQLGVGICALLAPWMFAELTALYVWVYRTFAPDFYSFNVLRFGLATLVLLVPTSLIGGTLPVISQLLARQQQRRGGDLGALYAANTFGGVVGTLGAGLFLIRWLGAQQTVGLAAALDVIVAGGALALSREQRTKNKEQRTENQEPENQRTREQRTKNKERAPAGSTENRAATKRTPQGSLTQSRKAAKAESAADVQHPASSHWLALWGFALSGFASLGYEVVWTRLLAIFSLNAVFSFTIMLTTFLVGLALGGALAARRIDRVAQPLALFGYLQLGIGLCAVLVLFVFAKLPTLLASIQHDTFGRQIALEFLASAITMLVPATLMGAMFPVAARIYTGAGGAVGERVGRLYAMNTVGSMLGAFVAGFVSIPLLGLQSSALTLAIVNLALGAAALLACATVPRLRLGGALAVAVVAALLLPPGIYLGFREGTTPLLVFYREGADATVSVFQVPDPPLKISFVNGLSEVPTDRDSMRAFYLLGHLPALLRPDAQSALMVSFGNGIATGALSRHHIPRIQAVELVAEQVEAARIYQQENRGVLDYPGLNIAIEDGRNYLLRSDQRFDIIAADATHPINTSSWALFTREFYTLVRQRLADDGVFVQWLPFHDLSEQDYRDIVKTFQSVFPHSSLWYTGGTHSFLVATPQRLTRADVLALDAQIKASGIGDDLGDGQQLASDFLMDEDAVASYTSQAREVTDDSAFFIPERDMDVILQGFSRYAEVGKR